MARIIVNEGEGPRSVALSAERTVVGSNPQCDVVLTHDSALGARFAIVRDDVGWRVEVVKGAVLLNESAVEGGPLAHNDTLRVGESMILFKDPAERAAGHAPDVGRAPAATGAMLEGLPPIEDLAEAGAPVADAPRADVASTDEELLDEPEELDELEELDQLEELEELDELEAIDDVQASAEPAPLAEAEEPSETGASVEEPVEADPVEFDAFEEDVEPSAADEVEAPAPAPEPVLAMAAPVERASPAAPRRATGPIRFRRPLPPGCKAPTHLPPPHPGRPPR